MLNYHNIAESCENIPPEGIKMRDTVLKVAFHVLYILIISVEMFSKTS